MLKLHIPCALEHIAHHRQQRFCGRQAAQPSLKGPFQFVAADGFAVRAAALLEAHVIGMPISGFALGPARGERVSAFSAGDSAAQREILIEISPRRRIGLARQTALYPAISRQADQPVMLGLAQGNAPFGTLNHSRVERLI
ncbi:MAG: hypothetical protein AAGP08_16935 [Pseudomonadota bacterium]